MKKVAILGECMIELNGQQESHQLSRSYGGDTLNTATYIARLTHETVSIGYLTAMGSDSLSKSILNSWQSDHICTDKVLIDDNHSPGLYLIELDERGERTFLYWRNDSAARYIFQHHESQKVFDAMLAADVIYLSGISLAILPDADRKTLIDFLSGLDTSDKTIVFDSNFRPKLWPSLAVAQKFYNDLYKICDLALVTDEDEQMLWNDTTPESTADRLHNLGVSEAVVKMGAEGCLHSKILNSEKLQQYVKAEVIDKPVDTTGAGDAFNAGFLANYLLKGSSEDACHWGNSLARSVIQHKGAIIEPQYMPTLI